MEAEDAFSMDLMGPSAEDKANGAALLSAALVREAGALADAAAGLRATLDLADGDTPRGALHRAGHRYRPDQAWRAARRRHQPARQLRAPAPPKARPRHWLCLRHLAPSGPC